MPTDGCAYCRYRQFGCLEGFSEPRCPRCGAVPVNFFVLTLD